MFLVSVFVREYSLAMRGRTTRRGGKVSANSRDAGETQKRDDQPCSSAQADREDFSRKRGDR